MEKINFAKFMPSTQQYIVIKGSARSPEDYGISVDIGDGDNKTSFYLDPWGHKDTAAIMKHMRDAMQQALEFYEKAMALPAAKPMFNLSGPWEDMMDSVKESKPKAKKAATKKKAAKK